MRKLINELAAALIFSGLSLAGGMLFAAEFEVLDRFSVDGYTVLRGSAAIPGGSFTVGGSVLVVKDGNVGIGTTAPGALFHVKNPAGDLTTRFEGLTNAYKSKMYLSSVSSGDGGLQYDSNSNQTDIFSYGDIKFNAGTGNISGAVANERMRITQSGNVGIGTAGPVARLNIALSGTTAAKNTVAAFGAGGIVQLSNIIGTNTGDEIGFFGSNGTPLGQIAAGFGFLRENAGNWATALKFYTHSPSTSVIDEIIERMRIDSAGNVGIGTANPGKKLDVVGDIRASGNVYLSANDFARLTAWMSCVAAGKIAGKTIALLTWPQDARTTTCDSLCSTAVGPNGTTGYTCISGGYFGYTLTQNTSAQGSIGERLIWGACADSYGPGTSYGYQSSMGYYLAGSDGTGSGHICCCGQ